MRKKTIYIVMSLLLLTGCKVEYKINLEDTLDINENINLIATTEEDKTKFNEFNLYIPVDKDVDDYASFENKIDDLEYYNQAKEENLINFNYKFKKDNYGEYINSFFANTAYEYISISEMENILVLSSSKEFLLFEKYDNIEEVRLTINTNYKVLTNNADEVNNHDYTWIITEDNAYGKGIYLKVDTSVEDLSFLEKLLRGDYINIFTISLVILVIGFLVYKFLKKYSQKRDEI